MTLHVTRYPPTLRDTDRDRHRLTVDVLADEFPGGVAFLVIPLAVLVSHQLAAVFVVKVVRLAPHPVSGRRQER